MGDESRPPVDGHWSNERIVHCWEPGPDWHSTCMLLEHHDGPHKFTPDPEIGVSFA